MTRSEPWGGGPPAARTGGRPERRDGDGRPADLAEVLERVLDKGVVIAGDIRIDLLDIELLTIRLRLLVASVDRAREMGIDWWEHDPALSSSARREGRPSELAEENRRLREEVEALRNGGASGAGEAEPSGAGEAEPSGAGRAGPPGVGAAEGVGRESGGRARSAHAEPEGAEADGEDRED
ncbi:gas vesicle protein [Nocardiopsis sp. RSe5-2]|uniref:Gas vesicle protein n=1 Tax=Nocardiopsis endophytica TaxID=3018445 RepID=A0ABT4UDC6_9ACTN|nr:gas vesicle protein GvpJ [Nocardiopsis endophytica]MDA2814913.1 gas vesicle protein [Nocardiopsis endophytica]